MAASRIKAQRRCMEKARPPKRMTIWMVAPPRPDPERHPGSGDSLPKPGKTFDVKEMWLDQAPLASRHAERVPWILACAVMKRAGAGPGGPFLG